MRLLGFGATNAAEKDLLLINGEIAAISGRLGLSVLLGGIREYPEVIDDLCPATQEILAALAPDTSVWEVVLDEAYESLPAEKGGEVGTPRAFLPLSLAAAGAHGESTPFDSQSQIALAMTRDEILACIALCEAALEGLEDWEYATRMGVSESETRMTIESLKVLLQS